MFVLQVELIDQYRTLARTSVSFEDGAVLLNRQWGRRRPESVLGMGWWIYICFCWEIPWLAFTAKAGEVMDCWNKDWSSGDWIISW